MQGYTKGTTPTGEMTALREAFVKACAAIWAGPDAWQAWQQASELGDLMGELRGEAADFRGAVLVSLKDTNRLSIADLVEVTDISKPRVTQLLKIGRTKGLTAVTDPGTLPELPSVAAAIITSDLGVLIERRNDKIPPWTFPAGEIQPGETPFQCVERRVPAETGVTATAERTIGSRVHPKTGRTMHYVLATVSGTDVRVVDAVDLAEVKWASAAETRDLMPDMFEPVREHLDRVLEP